MSKLNSVSNNFNLDSDTLAAATSVQNALANCAKTEKAFGKSKENKTLAFQNAANLLDDQTKNCFSFIKFNKIKAGFGSEKYLAECTEVGSEFELSSNQVKLVDSFRKQLNNDQAYQNIKAYSLGFIETDSRKSKNPDHLANVERAKETAEPKVIDTYSKVIKTLCSQYQHIGKVEEKNDSLDNLMRQIGGLLELNDVDLETL